MNNSICYECDSEFESDVELHRHIRSHKMHIAQYYHKHYPRYDLFSNELIVFKDKEWYFSHLFNNRSNFKSWYVSANREIVKKYCSDFIKERKQDKNLVYAPCQVELRSLLCPSVIGYDQLFGDYYKMCFELGLRVKYERFHVLRDSVNTASDTIIIDTREQAPLLFNTKIKIDTLSFGDYGYERNGMNLPLYFERKSLGDFVNSFGRDYERVKAEISRAVIDGSRLIVIVEEDLKYVLCFSNYLRSNIKATPDFIFHNVRQLCQEFPNIQFLFARNRKEASRLIEKIFKYEGEHFKFDLQLAYDLGKL